MRRKRTSQFWCSKRRTGVMPMVMQMKTSVQKPVELRMNAWGFPLSSGTASGNCVS